MSENFLSTLVAMGADVDLYERSLEDIFFDFAFALDEAIATYNVLEEIKKIDPKPNQLLFCHIVNGFDAFIDRLFETAVTVDLETLREYFSSRTNLDEKVSIKEILEINSLGVKDWLKTRSAEKIEEDLRRKRHSQVLEELLKMLGIDDKKLFVCLSGGTGSQQSGCIKKKPTKADKRTPNHKTTPEKLLGYADFLYEKRNAITHNRNKYFPKVLKRLNQEWKVEIKFEHVVIKRDTINSVIRFYASLLIELLYAELVVKYVESEKLNQLLNNFENLKEMKNIKAMKNGPDARAVSGGFNSRRAFLAPGQLDTFTLQEYINKFDVSSSTASRDIKKFQGEGLIQSNHGSYQLTAKKQGTRPD